MAAVAKVMVDVKVGRALDYSVPPDLASQIAKGSQVTVPLGSREVRGVVVALADRSQVARLRPILAVADDHARLGPDMLKLADWMADYYFAPLEAALRVALPGAVRKRNAKFKERLRVRLPAGEPDIAPSAAAPSARSARLTPGQRIALERLAAQADGMWLSELTSRPPVSAAMVQALARKGRVVLERAAMRRDPLAHREILPAGPLALMPEQQAALDKILDCCRNSRSAAGGRSPTRRVTLLYGVTGSGKTEVYLQAIDAVLKQGFGAIVLVPEISLTPQTVDRFESRFGERIAVLHSRLSDGERHDEWSRVHKGEATIVVGARSAVFAPVRKLGLIVVDEEHDTGYKQEDTVRYNARDVAVMRGRIEDCAVALGSATPSLESWHNARTGKYRLAVLPRRADNRQMPTVRVVDMRAEAEAGGPVGVFSRALVEAVRGRLERGEQTILFLNRRGYATSLICPHCGFVAHCDHCSVALTYHRIDERLRCHICGDSRVAPQHCPSCGDPTFKFSGIGTQRVETIVNKLFPHARTQRMDADMTTRKNSHDRILGAFRGGKLDILIGTQMIAKGLHFPNVTLVGVIYADLSLHMPDFRAAERTFQLLAQVAGRAGRGEVNGEVVIQTYTPFHPAVQAARRVDYEGFCDEELEFRKELSYPPYSRLICLGLKGPNETTVSYCAACLAKRLQEHPAAREGVHVSQSAPAPLARAKAQYRFQVLMRGPSVRRMTGMLSEALTALTLPREVVLAVDVDALHLL
jgi:primosomal protein N' (replication factor Y) (superfamily II helicase)